MTAGCRYVQRTEERCTPVIAPVHMFNLWAQSLCSCSSNSETCEAGPYVLLIQLLLLYTERRQLKWLNHLTRTPPVHRVMFYLSGRTPQDRPGQIMSPCCLRKGGGGGWVSLLGSLPPRLGAAASSSLKNTDHIVKIHCNEKNINRNNQTISGMEQKLKSKN